jgi:hypothetical protein
MTNPTAIEVVRSALQNIWLRIAIAKRKPGWATGLEKGIPGKGYPEGELGRRCGPAMGWSGKRRDRGCIGGGVLLFRFQKVRLRRGIAPRSPASPLSRRCPPASPSCGQSLRKAWLAISELFLRSPQLYPESLTCAFTRLFSLERADGCGRSRSLRRQCCRELLADRYL